MVGGMNRLQRILAQFTDGPKYWTFQQQLKRSWERAVLQYRNSSCLVGPYGDWEPEEPFLVPGPGWFSQSFELKEGVWPWNNNPFPSEDDKGTLRQSQGFSFYEGFLNKRPVELA